MTRHSFHRRISRGCLGPFCPLPRATARVTTEGALTMCQALYKHTASFLLTDIFPVRDYHLHFTDGQTKVQRGEATGPKSHSNGPDLNPGLAEPQDHALCTVVPTPRPHQSPPPEAPQRCGKCRSPHTTPVPLNTLHRARQTNGLNVWERVEMEDSSCSHDRWPSSHEQPHPPPCPSLAGATGTEPPGSARVPVARARPLLGL